MPRDASASQPAPSRQTAAGAQESDGAEANSRLTSTTGMLLLVMLAVEGYTILDVRGLITLHIFLGVMLLGPVLLKTASTTYRFALYYQGKPGYVRRGPPHPVLRALGPVVILSSLAVLGTGVGLLAVAPGHGPLLLLHKASFVVWFAVMAVHVLGHLRQALLDTGRELRGHSRQQRIRLAAIALALVAGVAAAALLLPTADSWTHRDPASQQLQQDDH